MSRRVSWPESRPVSRPLRRVLLPLLAAVAPLLASAQVTPTWTTPLPGTVGSAIALDALNNGYSVGSTPTPALVVSKLGPTGALLWQRSITVPNARLSGDAIVVDAAGVATVAGTLLPPTGTVPAGTVVARFDAASTLLWQDVAPATAGAVLRIATDAAGNTVALSSQRRADPVLGNVTEAVLVKFDPAGHRLWQRVFGATGGGQPDDLVLTAAGDAIVAARPNALQNLLTMFDAAGNTVLERVVIGGRPARLAIGAGGEVVLAGGGSDGTSTGFLVARLDAGLNLQWRRVLPANGNATQLAIGGNGRIVVAGATDTATGSFTQQQNDWLVASFDSAGNLLWSRIEGANGAEAPYALAIGADAAIYLTGEGRFAVAEPTGVFILPSTLTTKLAPDGTPLWSSNVGPTSVAEAGLMRGIGLALRSDGGAIVQTLAPQSLARYEQGTLPNRAPTAVAGASPSAGPAPLAVAFSAAGSTDPDGPIAGYAWRFGDGGSSSLPNPTHTYAAGQYTATLVVTDAQGAASPPASVVVTSNAVLPQPVALTLAKSSVRGGNSTTATVRLSTSAGATVTLASSLPKVASVPASVSMRRGSSSASFTIRTSRVTASTPVTIRATANGATVTTTLTVTR